MARAWSAHDARTCRARSTHSQRTAAVRWLCLSKSTACLACRHIEVEKRRDTPELFNLPTKRGNAISDEEYSCCWRSRSWGWGREAADVEAKSYPSWTMLQAFNAFLQLWSIADLSVWCWSHTADVCPDELVIDTRKDSGNRLGPNNDRCSSIQWNKANEDDISN